MSNKIKVGVLVSYDYEMIYQSLPLYYNHVDEITLAIDVNHRTWSGNYFEIQQSFFEWIEKIDQSKKIRLYRDNFYFPKLTVKESDTSERNMLGKFMGEGGWHLQIDADEYFLDFPAFKTELLKNPTIGKPIAISVPLIPLFKKTDTGFLYISNPEKACVATNFPVYTDYRINTNLPVKFINAPVIHETWARNEELLLQKLNNWSHKSDFDTQLYFNFWKSIDAYNYKFIQNLHPIKGENWKSLRFIEGKTMMEVIANFKENTVSTLNFDPYEIFNSIPISTFLLYKIKRKINQLFGK